MDRQADKKELFSKAGLPGGTGSGQPSKTALICLPVQGSGLLWPVYNNYHILLELNQALF
jgi:membrane-bound lytic murein transglycosylase B